METYFNEHGFLADDVGAITQQIAEEYADWIKVLRGTNQAAVGAQYQAAIRDNAQDLLTGALYSRVVSTLQGATLLLFRGMPSQARMLLRVSMEALFTLLAVAKSAEFTDRYIAADEIEREKLFKKARRWQTPALRELAEESASDSVLAEIKEQIRALNARALKVEDVAIEAGLHDWYLSAYSVLCAPVHTSIRDLQRGHMKVNADGVVEELLNEPQTADLHSAFLIAIELLLVALRAFSQRFKLPYEAFEEKTYAELRRLCAKADLAS